MICAWISLWFFICVVAENSHTNKDKNYSNNRCYGHIQPPETQERLLQINK